MMANKTTRVASDSYSSMPVESITHSILVLRGHKVLLDEDLAALYGVTTKRLNEQVRRNLSRFPGDFMFQLENQDLAALRSQSATLKRERGKHRKYAPRAFTEHGAIMAATILATPRAVEMSVFVVRAFVQLREALSTSREIARQLQKLERKVGTHDQAIVGILKTLHELMNPPRTRAIGFTADF
jgi:hypothetical protein